MKTTRILMDMPITVEIIGPDAADSIKKVFEYFEYIDRTFSTYKKDSEISRINRGRLHADEWSRDMKQVFTLCEQTRKETNGYFDIYHEGKYDPSGLVKGWAVFNAAGLLKNDGFSDFYVEAGGDIQTSGVNAKESEWTVGIRNPFNRQDIVKVLRISEKGIATSGTYIRGQHIYNPHDRQAQMTDIVSLTVIGPNVYEADRFATAAFAMQRRGIEFIERLPGFEGYMIDSKGKATYSSGFNSYTAGT